ncbi:hypothetical protein H9P43_009879 [Blastocladiella emersonii ATCC 22665]|nr:hypothetical protein H9P43_009879 [Blastocladiella emersonii ATCC 22665]
MNTASEYLAVVSNAVAPLKAQAADLLGPLVNILGPRKSVLLAALSTVAVLCARFWYRNIRVPPSLRHVPRLTVWQTIRVMTSGAGFLDSVDQQLRIVRTDALKRGVIQHASETPKIWLIWFLGSWAVVIANPADIKSLLLGHEVFDKFEMTRMGLQATADFMGTNLALANTAGWKRQRKVVSPIFRRGWATSLFSEPTRILLSKFDAIVDTKGATVDVPEWMMRITLDALCSSAFGTNIDSLNHPDSPIVRSYIAAMEGMFNPKFTILAPVAWVMPEYWAYKRAVDEFNRYVYQMIDAKADEIAKRAGSISSNAGDDSDENNVKDLLETMIIAGQSGGFSREDLRANTVAFFVAGHDTTANALTFALYLLGMHPEIQRKARAEVLAVMGDVEQGTPAEDFPYPTNDEQQRMSYVTYVIKETMRLYPSVGNLPPRILTSPAILSDGSRVPAGTIVSGNTIAIHRDCAQWGDDADEFKPERWADLGVGADGAIPMHPSAHDFKWVPFGGGQRICPGQSFSIIEQRVVLSMLLLRYEWTVAGNKAALAGRPGSVPGVMLRAKGIELALKRRN